MLDPRLWKTHMRQREQQFIREAERDRVAHEYRRAHNAHSPLAVALRDALVIVRARITPASVSAGTEPAKSQAPLVSDKIAVSILSEAEEVVRAYAGSPNDCTCCPC